MRRLYHAAMARVAHRGAVVLLTLAAGASWMSVQSPGQASGRERAEPAVRVAQALPPRDDPARTRGSGVIRGVVVDGTSGAPLRRAAVQLLIQFSDREGARVVATAADANGQFEFTGVPAARVQVTASRAGYFDYNNVWNGEPQEPEWQDIGPGQRVQGVRIALFRGGVIAGRISDEFGEPAAGVEVEVLRRDPGEAELGVRTTSSFVTPTTDDTGAFRVWGLAPGDYVVGARPNRFVAVPADETEPLRDGYAPTYFPGTPVLARARMVRVAPGRESAGVAFALTRVSLSTLRGTVLLPEGLSARAVNVGLGLVAPERLDGFATRGTRLRDDATFEIGRLAPGSYQLTARYQQGDANYYGTSTVEVGGVDLDGAVVPMKKGALVRGRVLDEGGQPINVPVMVSLVAPTKNSRTPAPSPERSYSDGSFRLTGAFGQMYVRAQEARLLPTTNDPLLAGRRLQEVTPASRPLTTWWLASILVNGRDVTDEPVDFDHGDVELAITMTNRASNVRGAVTWNRARSGRRPAVVVFVDDESAWSRPTRRIGTSEVEPDGRFDVRGLPPGPRYLAAAVEGASRAVLARPEVLQSIRPFATPLRIDERGIHELALTAIPRP